MFNIIHICKVVVLLVFLMSLACGCVTKRSVINAEYEQTSTVVDSSNTESYSAIQPLLEDSVYLFVDQMPQFPGGKEALLLFLKKNLEYPAIYAETCIQGRVYVEFIVSDEGEILRPQIYRTLDVLLDTEALRVVKSMPRWIPGMQDGIAVNVYYVLPVNFSLR